MSAGCATMLSMQLDMPVTTTTMIEVERVVEILRNVWKKHHTNFDPLRFKLLHSTSIAEMAYGMLLARLAKPMDVVSLVHVLVAIWEDHEFEDPDAEMLEEMATAMIKDSHSPEAIAFLAYVRKKP